MIPVHIRFLATRAGRGAAFALVLAALAIAACSSDPRSTLGSDDDLLGSGPGTIFDDTLDVSADTTYAYATALASDSVLELGRGFGPDKGYERAMVIQINWVGAASNTSKTVDSALLRLTADDVDGTFPARFYRLTEPYAEGDSLPTLDTLAVVVDPGNNSPNRTLQTVPRDYALPPALVQQWIRNETERTALAIVCTDSTERVATFKSAQAAKDRPQVLVNFVGGASATYKTSGDATLVRPTNASSNLVISDGYVRRLYFRIPFDQLADRAAVHNARVRFYLVPGSELGSAPNLIVFIPASSDPTSKEFLSGQNVTTLAYQASADYVEFAMTNAIALTLEGTIADDGVVIRYDAENSSLRQVAFYGSNAPASLRPRLYITSSTPADFHPGTP